MNVSRIVALVTAIASAAATAELTHVYARERLQMAQAGAEATPAPRERGAPPQGRRDDQRPPLFTPEERAQFEQKMKSARTPEERDALRREMRMAFEKRAQERGIALRPRAEGRPQLSRQDHQRYQERWSNTKTPEERDALRREILAAVEERARARQAMPGAMDGPGPRGPGGPEQRGEQRQGERDRAESGRDERRGSLAQLFTQQERQQFRERMHNARDREERMKIRGELQALAQARAREKGMQLPERGRFEHRRRPEGGPRDDTAPRSQG